LISGIPGYKKLSNSHEVETSDGTQQLSLESDTRPADTCSEQPSGLDSRNIQLEYQENDATKTGLTITSSDRAKLWIASHPQQEIVSGLLEETKVAWTPQFLLGTGVCNPFKDFNVIPREEYKGHVSSCRVGTFMEQKTDPSPCRAKTLDIKSRSPLPPAFR
jgi:hypothetical protein